MRIITGRRARAVAWAVCSSAATQLAGLVPAALLASRPQVPPSNPLGPVWGDWAWWVAIVVYVGVLAAGPSVREPSGRRYVLLSVAAAAGYVLAGGALSTLADIGTADPDVAGSGWGSAIEGVVLVSVFFWGNGATALIAPLLLGLLPVFRPVTLGRPARWRPPHWTSADDDAVAEDFGIR